MPGIAVAIISPLVSNGAQLNHEPKDTLLTEDVLFYFVTEDELNYIQQEIP